MYIDPSNIEEIANNLYKSMFYGSIVLFVCISIVIALFYLVKHNINKRI